MKKEKPIIFGSPMIKAIDNTKPGVWPAEPIDPSLGFKSMTRRVVPEKVLEKWSDYYDFIGQVTPSAPGPVMREREFLLNYSKYKVGDILWIKEAFCKYVPEHIIDGKEFVYKADSSPVSEELRKQYVALNFPYKWKIPWYMPRIASRYQLEVKSVRVERVMDISYQDTIAEGIYCYPPYPGDKRLYPMDFRKCYRDLWNSINEKRGYEFALNSWVYVIEFMRIK
jgi:hypothetical protein